jgi:ABC-type branched-subunit amino acid transport system ATPase component
MTPGGYTATISSSILRTEQCTIQFGGLVAVNKLDINVSKGDDYL